MSKENYQILNWQGGSIYLKDNINSNILEITKGNTGKFCIFKILRKKKGKSFFQTLLYFRKRKFKY